MVSCVGESACPTVWIHGCGGGVKRYVLKQRTITKKPGLWRTALSWLNGT